MRITYQYRIRPTASQAAAMLQWLELLRKQYNYRLGERFDWERLNKCPVDRCSLVSCSIAPPKAKPNYYSQQHDLLHTKKLFPEYTAIHSQVLQDCVKRVDQTWQRFIQGDSNGKHSGRPRFKGKGRYHSFTYTQMKVGCLDGKRLTLPKLGAVNSRRQSCKCWADDDSSKPKRHKSSMFWLWNSSP